MAAPCVARVRGWEERPSDAVISPANQGWGRPRRKRIRCRAAELQRTTRLVSLRRYRGLNGSGWDGVTGWAGAEVEAEGDGGVHRARGSRGEALVGARQGEGEEEEPAARAAAPEFPVGPRLGAGGGGGGD